MEINVPAATLSPILRSAAAVAPKKDPRPILRNVLLRATDAGVEALATNVGTALRLKIESDELKVVASGEILTEAKRLLDLVRANPKGTVRIKTDKKGARATVTFDSKRQFKVVCEDPKDFPPARAFEGKLPTIKVPAAQLTQMLARTLPVAHDEESRYLMHGLNVEVKGGRLRLVATDGLHLALASIEVEGLDKTIETNGVVPADMAVSYKFAYAAEDDVEMQFTQSSLNLRGSLGEVGVIRLAGNFPPYERGIPTQTVLGHKLTFKRGELSSLFKQALLLKEGTMLPTVRLVFGDGHLTITARLDNNTFEESVPIEWPEGEEPITMFYNPAMIAAALKVMSSEQIRWEFKDSTRPTIIRELDKTMASFYVIAPLIRGDFDA